MKTPPLEYGKFFHIYNRGTNSCQLFHHYENYEYFLGLYDKYISPVANTFAWVLMGNHFHLLVRIKEEDKIGFVPPKEIPKGLKDASGLARNLSTDGRHESVLPPKKYKPVNQFSHLFNAYTKAFNKRYKRTGSLFEHPFRRIEIKSESHLKYMVYYIHHNPVHHGFCEEMIEHPWSSYLTIVSPKQTKLKRDEVLKWYNQKENFKGYHDKQSLKKYNELHIDLPVLQQKREQIFNLFR